MKLYFASGTCSFSPHIILQELGMPYDLVRVNNKTKQTSEGNDFRTVNPKGYVAALQLETGTVLTEGPAIVQYLADLKPETGLAPANGTFARSQLQEWLSFVNSEIHAGVGPLFNPAFPEEARTIFKDKLAKRLDLIADRLADNAYLMGDTFTVADAYLFTVFGWFSHLAIDLGAWPAIAEYVKRIEARPSVAAARAREADIALVA
jgi:glutathione S-transferase